MDCRDSRAATSRSSSPKVGAAIQWLTFAAYWESAEYPYRIEVISEVTGSGFGDQAEQAGLEMIVLNSYLDSRYRVAADAELAQRRGRPAQLLLRSLVSTVVLIADLAELAEHGNDAAFTALRRLAEDDSLTVDDRIDIAEMLTELDHDAGFEAFNTLRLTRPSPQNSDPARPPRRRI